MLPLVFIIIGFDASFSCKVGITSCISLALDRIQLSNRYDLIPGVFFSRTRNESQNLPQSGSLFSKAEKVFKTHDLHWNALPGIDFKVSNGEKGFSLKVDRSHYEVEDSSRTFGFRRRLKMVLLPIMFKLGVITTLLTMLTIFSLKGLTVGIFLLALALGSLFSKLKYGHHSSHGWEQQGWEHPHKEVHFHVHPYMSGHGHWQRMDPYYPGPNPYMDPSNYQLPQYPYPTSRSYQMPAPS